MSLETLTSCPLCGATESVDLGRKRDAHSGETFTVQACHACGLGYVNPRPDTAAIGRYYSEHYSWQEEADPGFANRLEKFYRFQLLHYECRRLRRFSGKRNGTVLDVGCGSGDRLTALATAGFSPSGLESGGAVDGAVGSARWPIQKVSLDAAEYPPRSFDLITLYNVLEHLHAPSRAVAKVRHWLKPGGVLVVQVPNRRSWQAGLFGLRWAAVDVPRDLYYFDPKLLRRLLEEQGFRVEALDFRPHLLHPPTWVLSLFPGLDPRSVWASQRPWVNLAKRVLWGCATLALGPLGWLEAALGRGASMTAYARLAVPEDSTNVDS